MRILPRPQREAMFEIYSFCRAVDDIADDLGPREPRREQLQCWRSDIDAIYGGAPPPALLGLAQAVRAFLSSTRRLHGGDRRHGDGRDRRYPRSRLGDT